MRPLALSAACLIAACAPAAAQRLPVDGTTYIEQSLNHSGTLVIEHPPVAVNPEGRLDGRAAIAGFCRDGGLVYRRDSAGDPVILRQREICDSIAPLTLDPGEVRPRPTWPSETAADRGALRSRIGAR